MSAVAVRRRDVLGAGITNRLSVADDPVDFAKRFTAQPAAVQHAALIGLAENISTLDPLLRHVERLEAALADRGAA
jgi:hypothetical protein